MAGGNFLGAILQVVVGVVLVATGNPAGIGLIVGGLFSAAAIAFAPDTTSASDPKRSPTYGYTQYQNPVKGDTPIYVTYSHAGHRLAPIWLQAFITPKGFEGSDQAKQYRSRGQALSGMLALGEGPIEGIDQVEVNDQPLFTAYTDVAPAETTNGTRKLFTLTKSHVDLPSVMVTVEPPGAGNISVVGGNKFQRASGSFVTDGWVPGGSVTGTGFTNAANNATFTIIAVSAAALTVSGTLTNESASSLKQVTGSPTIRGFLKTSGSALIGIGDGSTTMYSFALPDSIVQEEPIRFWTSNPLATTSAIELTEEGTIAPRAWLVDPTRLLINTQTPYPLNQALWISYSRRTLNNLTSISRNSDGFVEILFPTAPPAGSKVRASYQRLNVPGFRFFFRPGSAHQLSIPGFDGIRNSQGVSAALPKNSSVSRTTTREVDDLVLDFASGANGMGSLDDTGDLGPESALVKITIQLVTSQLGSTGSPNYYNTARVVYDPAGGRTTGLPKGADEFEFWGESVSQVFWSLSIRGLLEKRAEDRPNDLTAQQALADFVRARYVVTVVRTNTVKSDTNSRYFDEVSWTSYQEVLYEFLNYPGTALLAFHALASEKLNGAAPNITVRLKGRSSVLRWNGTQWISSITNQANRVWAAIDLLTHPRYGCGDVYDKDRNFDKASALVAANWLDANVVTGNGSSALEVRSRLDITLDTRRAPLEHARSILLPGRVWLVQQGDVFKFVVDDQVTLIDTTDGSSAVPVKYDDTPAGRTAKNTLQLTSETIAASPTELQLTYLDEAQDWEEKQVWAVTPTSPTKPRRIQRASGYGMTRVTEAVRYGWFLFGMSRLGRPRLVVGITPDALNWEAGQVFRVISQRVMVDGYWRVGKMTANSNDFFVRIEARPYDHSVYNTALDKMPILLVRDVLSTSTPISGPYSAGGVVQLMAGGAVRV